tara:strand:+ start:878 stop:1078 length:201 start_codon:yes stop_codon:yes gene_type:complete
MGYLLILSVIYFNMPRPMTKKLQLKTALDLLGKAEVMLKMVSVTADEEFLLKEIGNFLDLILLKEK